MLQPFGTECMIPNDLYPNNLRESDGLAAKDFHKGAGQVEKDRRFRAWRATGA